MIDVVDSDVFFYEMLLMVVGWGVFDLDVNFNVVKII